MGLLDNYTGIGMSPRPRKEHQKILKNLIINLDQDDISALTEQCVDEFDLDSKAPDVVIYEDDNNRYPDVIIEITTHDKLKKIKDKVLELLQNYPVIKEAFVFDYETKKWFAFGAVDNEDSPSYSPFFDVDFDDYL